MYGWLNLSGSHPGQILLVHVLEMAQEVSLPLSWSLLPLF